MKADKEKKNGITSKVSNNYLVMPHYCSFY